MKKLLALVLALVMVMGLSTVGANAALKDYSDVADINYDEAVAVMTAIGVLEGADGKFRPSVELKRSEAAKIVAYLNTNNRTAEGLVGVGKFSDVPTNHWAAGYIDYLTSVGVLAGRGDVFDPDGDLKAIDFAKMLLVVIGFDPQIEGLVGNDYQINASKLGTNAGLFAGLSSLKPGDTLTREQAAQMAFNAIKAATVEYANKGGSISINGADINLGASNYNYVTTTLAKEQRISNRKLTNTDLNSDGGYTVEFGERQYPDLRLNETYDDFGRPASEWTYGKENVGKFINKDLLMGDFTTAVTGADLFDLIGEAKIKNSENIIYKVNGMRIEYLAPNSNEITAATAYRSYGVDATNMIRANKVPYAFTGNGVLTEVYEKNDDLIIVSIFTYYGAATADYNERTGKLLFASRLFDNSPTTDTLPLRANCLAPDFVYNPNALLSIDAEDFPSITKYKEKDKLLMRFAYVDGAWKVAEVDDPTIEAGATITRFKTDAVGARAGVVAKGLFYEGWVVAGGETKNYSKAVYPNGLFIYNDKALDTTYDLVYDKYGYVIATLPNATSDKYVFIAGIDNHTSNLGMMTADAFAIFSDGSSATIKVNVSKSNEEIEKYEDVRSDHYVTDANGNPVSTYSYNGYRTDPFYSIRYDLLSGTESRYAYNRWFSYTTSGEGSSAVYTLYPAPNTLMVRRESASNTHVSATDPRVVINPKTARLIGDYKYYDEAMDVGGANYPVSQLSAWGNTDSVYITVKTGRVSAQNVYQTLEDTEVYKRGIAEVSGIFTGIQDIDLTEYPSGASADENTSKKLNPYPHSIFAVYDEGSRYIKSAIVIGSDQGNTDNYIYAISGAGSEWKEGSYYYWNFNAIVDGEEKELTVKTEYRATIDNIQNAVKFNKDGTVGGLFQVTLDQDGYVTAASQVGWATNNTVDADDVIYNNWELHGGNRTVNSYALAFDKQKVYNTYFWQGDTYRAQGLTLWNNFSASGGTAATSDYIQGSDIGLTVAAGAPIYTVQQYYVRSTGQTITWVQRWSDFKSALGGVSITDTGDQQGPIENSVFRGYVSAALNANGTAKWVVMKNVGTTVGMANNTGSSNVATGKSVILSDYDLTANDVGFVVTLGGFSTSNLSYTLYERQAGQTTYDVAKTGTVAYNTAAVPFTNGGGINAKLGAGAAVGKINIAGNIGTATANEIYYPIRTNSNYYIVIEGIESGKVPGPTTNN